MKTLFYPVLNGTAISILAVVVAITSQYHCGASTLLVYNNNDSGAGSLRQAVNDNNALGGGNTIIFSNIVTGTITLTGGKLVISQDVTILGPGPNVLSVSGNNTDSVFWTTNNSTSTMSGLTITAGLGSFSGDGGGIFNSVGSTLTVSNCAFAHIAVSGFGGGIANHGTLTVDSSTFDSNSAYEGSGIYNVGTLRITSCTFSRNTGSLISYGGGIENQSILAVSNCTFSGNSAQYGSDIDSVFGTPTATVISSTFSGISGDPANSGYSINMQGSLTIGNTIFNSSTPNILKNSGTITSLGYNLCSDSGGGSFTGVGDQINTAPKLGPLQNNGGPTMTMGPRLGSPAIDQGNSFGQTTDQRGLPRPYDNPGIPNAAAGDGSDIGAVEVQSGEVFPSVVTTTNDSGSGSLRQVLLEAGSGETVFFAPNVIGTITLTNGELDVSNSITILGPGANVLAVSGNNSSRIFSFLSGVSSVSGLTIRDGLVSTALLGLTEQGGGLFNQATLSLADCTFTGNYAQGGSSVTGSGGSGNGGAVYNSGTLTLDRCTLNGNGAGGGVGGASNGRIGAGSGGRGAGGGIFNDTAATLTMNNCTFFGNTGSGGSGGSGVSSAGGNGGGGYGAVFNQGTLTMTSCTLSSNSAVGGNPGTGTPSGATGAAVGGLTTAAGTAAIRNSIVAADSAGDVSGAFTSSGYNIIGNTSGSSGFGAAGDQLNINPLLGPLQNNGGQTPTMAPISSSPAIDKGKSFGLTTDQRGAPRPFDFSSIGNASGGDGSDIGAVELARPSLSIQQSGNAAVFSWLSSYGNFTLQSSTNLASSNSWAAVPGTPSVIGTQYFQTNQPIIGSKFFRLKSN